MESSTTPETSSSVAVINLSDARERHIRARRDAIVWLLKNPDIPGGDYVNASTKQAHLDEQGVAYFRKGLALFGITELDPADPAAFDRLMATWGTLFSVGGELLSRATFGAAAQDAVRSIWHPAYARYIDALWGADDATVRQCAMALGIQAGVAKKTAMLWQGPVPTA